MIIRIAIRAILLCTLLVLSSNFIIMPSATTPPPQYSQGQFAEYNVQLSLNSTITGTLNFSVGSGYVELFLNIPSFYRPSQDLSKNVSLQMTNGIFLYNNSAVALPFFYHGQQILSSFNGSFSKIDRTQKNTNTLQGGIIQFQPVTYQYCNETFITGLPHVRYLNNVTDISVYEYGTNSGLLFYLQANIAPDPVMAYVLGMYTVQKTPNGTIYYNVVAASFSLSKTNINLGSINYGLLILTILVIGLPLEIPLAIVVGVVLFLTRARKRKRFIRKR
jgi:hypothetical protein